MTQRSGMGATVSLFIGVFLLQCGHGLQGSLISIEAAKAEFSATTTGIIMSAFYVGLLLSSVVTPSIVERVGHIRVFAAFASIVSTAVLLIPVWIDPVWWFLMRLISGMCMAGLVIVTESWLNAVADNRNRGKLLSLYMIVMFSAFGLGQFLLNVSDTSGFIRFIVVSAMISLALVPISLSPSEAPTIESPRKVSFFEIYKASPLALVGIFVTGLGQSVFFSVGALYGIMQGLSLGYVSIMMALPPLAVIISQFPVGFLSDRYDRRIVLVVCTFASAVFALVTLYAAAISPVSLIALFSLFGAISFPLYSLAVAHANDNLNQDQMLGASSKLILIYGVGSTIGPTIAGGMMQQLGASGFMMFMIGIYGFLGVFAVYRMLRRPDIATETGEYFQMAPAVSPVAALAIAEQISEEGEAESAGADSAANP